MAEDDRPIGVRLYRLGAQPFRYVATLLSTIDIATPYMNLLRRGTATAPVIHCILKEKNYSRFTSYDSAVFEHTGQNLL